MRPTRLCRTSSEGKITITSCSVRLRLWGLIASLMISSRQDCWISMMMTSDLSATRCGTKISTGSCLMKKTRRMLLKDRPSKAHRTGRQRTGKRPRRKWPPKRQWRTERLLKRKLKMFSSLTVKEMSRRLLSLMERPTPRCSLWRKEKNCRKNLLSESLNDAYPL